MTFGATGVVVLTALLVGLNVAVIRRVCQSAYYEPQQQRLRFAMIWLVALAGALLCYELARQNLAGPGRQDRQVDSSDCGVALAMTSMLTSMSVNILTALPTRLEFLLWHSGS